MKLPIFESFDSHYDITETKKVQDFTFYWFLVNDNPYRIFIEDMSKYDMIRIGFENRFIPDRSKVNTVKNKD